MPIYEFEIQALIKVKVEGEDAEHARAKCCNNLSADVYDDKFSEDASVSDGKLIE